MASVARSDSNSGYESLDALGLADLIERGEASPGELLDEALRRRDGSDLNAIVRDMEGEARRVIAEGLPDDTVFRGVPFLIKDLGVAYRGVPTSAGSRFFDGTPASEDSDLVSLYRRAGLVVFGKTNTSELGAAMTTEPKYLGPTLNPWDRSRTPGGSSGGSAAAVADGIVPAAHGSDGGGSIRIPASCCGLFGLKPTRGRVPVGPRRGERAGGLSVDHVLTRSVRDSAALLDVSTGSDPGAPYVAPPNGRPFLHEVTADPGRLRIGLSVIRPDGTSVDAECRRAALAAAQLCEALGHDVEEAAPEWNESAMDRAYRVVVDVNLARAVRVQATAIGRDPGPGDLERGVHVRVDAGETIDAVAYVAALEELHRTGRSVARFFDRFDLFLTPTLGLLPPPIGTLNADSPDVAAFRAALTEFSPFTRLANVTGLPAMSVPLSWSPDGIPVGVHFLGPFAGEAVLFRMAGRLEEAQPWFGHRPGRTAP